MKNTHRKPSLWEGKSPESALSNNQGAEINKEEWKCHNAFARFEIRADGAKINVAEVYKESDAHMISASKEMYEALKAIDNEMACFPQNVQDKLANAIAKAEGKK